MEEEIAQIILQVKEATRNLPIYAVLVPYLNPYSRICQGVEITDLYAEEPGKGVGTTFMNLLLGITDKAEVSVYVRPACSRSRAFYSRFSFMPCLFCLLAHHYPIDLDE